MNLKKKQMEETRVWLTEQLIKHENSQLTQEEISELETLPGWHDAVRRVREDANRLMRELWDKASQQ
jgi:hypothetical protein